MLNFYTSGPSSLREELKLRYWRLVLRLTRFAAVAHQWLHLFYQNFHFFCSLFVHFFLLIPHNTLI